MAGRVPNEGGQAARIDTPCDRQFRARQVRDIFLSEGTFRNITISAKMNGASGIPCCEDDMAWGRLRSESRISAKSRFIPPTFTIRSARVLCNANSVSPRILMGRPSGGASSRAGRSRCLLREERSTVTDSALPGVPRRGRQENQRRFATHFACRVA